MIDEVRARLYPETLIARSLKPEDDDAASNASARLALDAEQESLARSLGRGITWLTGVAGSGKSLVLAARSRWLAAQHPDWSILLLCFNRALVPYLEQLVGHGTSQIQVMTFSAWVFRLGLRLPGFSDAEYDAKTKEAIKSAINRGLGRHEWDAVLVDEGQDFHPQWLAFVSRAVRPRHGGLLIASDGEQALYHHDITEILAQESIRHLHLSRNYRNTEAILRTARAVAASDNAGEAALAGAPVQCVWAESWDEQAAFVAHQIAWLVDQRGELLRDLAVLYPKRTGTVRRVCNALDDLEIPYYEVGRDRASKKLFDLGQDAVKLMTIHSAKGLEFRHVFLMGAEALKQATTDDAENANRLAYVGMTRAKDMLYLTYTRPNTLLKRAMEQPPSCECRTYPDDYDWSVS